MIWGLLIIVLLFAFAVFLLHSDNAGKDDFEHVRGTVLTSEDDEEEYDEDALILAGRPISEDVVRRHILIGGTTGSGKSVATLSPLSFRPLTKLQ